MDRKFGVLVVVSLGLWSAKAVGQGLDAEAVAREHHEVVRSLVDKWEDAAISLGYDLPAWEAESQRVLSRRSPEDLAAALAARSYDEMRAAVGLVPTRTDALGDAGQDLVFTPLSPCRIVASSAASGPYAGRLEPGVVRSFYHNADLGLQGGNPGGCGVPDDAVAIVATLGTAAPLSWGLISAWAYGQPQPPGNMVDYGDNYYARAASTTVLPVCQACGLDFSLMVSGPGATHVSVDVLGYFRPPAATPLACTNVRQPIAVDHGIAASTWRAYCPAGKTVSGGGIELGTSLVTGVGMLKSMPFTSSSLSGWSCTASNLSPEVRTFYCDAVCCQVPGR
jgi:hypothetical protein